MSIFEIAARTKLRFDTQSGVLNAEDLWDLPLTSEKRLSLDKLAITLNKMVNESEEVSFVSTRTSKNGVAKLQFDIVKHIIDHKIAKADEKSKAADKKVLSSRIDQLISNKQDEEMAGKSIEELVALRDKL